MGKRQASAGELMVAGTWALWPAARRASRSAAMVASRSSSEDGGLRQENVSLVAQRNDVQVGVGHLEASDGQARARHAECCLLGETNRARHLHEVRRDVRGVIGPRLIGAARDDQDVPG